MSTSPARARVRLEGNEQPSKSERSGSRFRLDLSALWRLLLVYRQREAEQHRNKKRSLSVCIGALKQTHSEPRALRL